MARPRKDSGSANARQRLIVSFWSLLREHKLKNITVGMVSEASSCNRGTFYYYFENMDVLVDAAIRNELLGHNDFLMKIFSLSSGSVQTTSQILEELGQSRMMLLFSQGGADVIEGHVKRFAVEIWQIICGKDEGELKDETRMILEYAVSGMLGLIAYVLGRDKTDKGRLQQIAFLPEVISTMVQRICDIEGIPREEIQVRLKMLNDFYSRSVA